MQIVLTRIDNRLLHGIVATQWVPKLGPQRIMVIDDDTAGNEIAKSSMRLARPAGTAISIISLETALANFGVNKYEGQSVFIITKSPATVRTLVERGVPITEVNVGATAQRDSLPGDVAVGRRVTISADEVHDYRYLMNHGVSVYVQYLLSERPVLLDGLLS